MAEDTEIDAICVEQILESFLAGFAGVGKSGGIPWPVAGDNDPGRHASVDTSQIRLEEFDLLVWSAKGTAVESRGPVLSVRCRSKVGFSVDHRDVNHAVVKGIPERRLSQAAGFQGQFLGGMVRGAGRESSRHCLFKPVHEISKVPLTFRAKSSGVGNLLTICFVVPRTGHIQLATGNGGKLVVELLQDSLIGVLAVEPIFGLEVPVIRVGEVARMNDNFIIIECGTKATNRGVCQLRVDGRDNALTRIVRGNGITILTIDAQIDHDIKVERSLIPGCARAEEVAHGRVLRVDLIEIRGRRGQIGQEHNIRMGSGSRVCCRGRR